MEQAANLIIIRRDAGNRLFKLENSDIDGKGELQSIAKLPEAIEKELLLTDVELKETYKEL